jgi:hypothetical protein
MSRQRLVESFAKTQRVNDRDVEMVNVSFRRTGSATTVTLGAPVNTGISIGSSHDLSDFILGPGTDFVLRAFERATGRKIANDGRGWLAAFHSPENPSAGAVNATYFLASRRPGW